MGRLRSFLDRFRPAAKVAALLPILCGCGSAGGGDVLAFDVRGGDLYFGLRSERRVYRAPLGPGEAVWTGAEGVFRTVLADGTVVALVDGWTIEAWGTGGGWVRERSRGRLLGSVASDRDGGGLVAVDGLRVRSTSMGGRALADLGVLRLAPGRQAERIVANRFFRINLDPGADTPAGLYFVGVQLSVEGADVWRAADGRLARLTAYGDVGAVAGDPEGRRLAFIRSRDAVVWDLWVSDAEGKRARKLCSWDAYVPQIRFDPGSGRLLAALMDRPSGRFRLVSVDVETGKEALVRAF